MNLHTSSFGSATYNFMEKIRGFHRPAQRVKLYFQLMVWAKESAEEKNEPSQWNIKFANPETAPKLLALFKESRKSEQFYPCAFESIELFAQVEELRRGVLLDEVQRSISSGVLHQLSVQDIFNVIAVEIDYGMWSMPNELSQLLIGLAQFQEADHCYAPWDHLGVMTIPLCLNDHSVYVETMSTPTQLALICLLMGLKPTIRTTDPLKYPMAINNGALDKFDVSIAMPPLNVKFDKVVESDLFDRFPEQTNSGNVLTVRHVLAQTKRRAIMVVAPSLLFSNGIELDLRRNLLEKGMIEKVISLPAGLMPGHGIAAAILVLDPRGGHQSVQFVDATDKQFVVEAPKANRSGSRVVLQNIGSLVDGIFSCEDQSYTKTVSVNEILEQDAQLQVNRYVLADDQKDLQRFLEQSQVVNLEDIVEIIRPAMPVKDADEVLELEEVTLSDLPNHGCISSASRLISLEKSVFKKQINAILKPHDIVLNIKGNIGKVGIVPLDVLQRTNNGWVATQSAYILRVKPTSPIKAPVLFILLRSAIGQALLQSITAGATIPLIKLSELRSLAIPLPNAELSAHVEQVFKREIHLQQQINELKQQQISAVSEIWVLN